MELKKLITGSVVAISLFGVSLGHSFLNASADGDNSRNSSIYHPNNLTPSHNGQSYSSTDNNSSESNSGTSNANIQIDNGLLNLDNVPNLNFNNNSISQYTTNLGLQNSNNNQSNGTNDQGELQVTDNRNTNGENSTKGPWSVKAKLGQVYKTDNKQNIPSNDSDWAINLNKTNGTNDEGHTPNLQQATLVTNRSDQPIMSTSDDSSSGHGVNTVQYNNSNSNTNDASLTIPYNVKLGTYNATVTWTLTASADASANLSH